MDNRFASTPSTVKLAAIILCIAAAVLTLVIAHRLDRFDGRRARWALPRRWRRVSLLDAVVIGVLLLWHVVGANTADDACQLGMARVSEQAGYMVNYFRYFGVPEHRLGQGITNVFGRFIQISTASIWVRIPALLLAAATWWLISCEVLPRIGTLVGSRTHWVPRGPVGLRCSQRACASVAGPRQHRHRRFRRRPAPVHASRGSPGHCAESGYRRGV